MNPLLILAYKISKLPRPAKVCLLYDPEIADADYIRHCFRPWLRWLTISMVQLSDTQMQSSKRLRKVGAIAVLHNPAEPPPAVAMQLAAAHGRPLITAQYPATGTLDSDFVREIAHHDFEIGGKNEWTGEPARYSIHTLRLLSTTHCFDFFPQYILTDLNAIKNKRRGPLRALDIGCGPLSWLRWGMLQGLLHVTGIDPLLDVYQIVLARHGFDGLPHLLPHEIQSVPIEGFSGSSKYDFIFTNNALDHTQAPLKAIRQIARLLAPDGLAVISVATNEGTRQNWDQLHKYNISHSDGSIVAQNESGVIQRLVGQGAPLALGRIVTDTEVTTVFTAQH